MAEFSLDAARRARAEANGVAHTFEFGGGEFTLPSEMPFSVVEAAVGNDLRSLVEHLLGDQAPAFFALEPTTEDLRVFSEEVAKLYAGISAGESSASGPSSKNATKTSRQRSKPSTDST